MIPEKFIVTAEGKFKPGLAVLLRFKMSEKNNYYYFVFLDDKGQAVVGIDELLKSFDQDRNFFLMDYSIVILDLYLRDRLKRMWKPRKKLRVQYENAKNIKAISIIHRTIWKI